MEKGGECSFGSEGEQLIPLLTLAACCPLFVHSDAGDGRLNIQ